LQYRHSGLDPESSVLNLDSRFRGNDKFQIIVKAYQRHPTGDLFDPRSRVQFKSEFKVHGIIQNYVADPFCGDKAAFIMWDNPAYAEG
jgi:hypothetical protein